MRLLEKLRAYFRVLTRPSYGGLPEPGRMLLRRPAIMAAVGAYETALIVSGRVDGRLKVLAQVKTSALIGCPF